ncbi:hypothetical protein OPV22_019365 [Ensete ventricosum]|uniref:Uncharacterized protein n=1 Tax=Ensete ventricosum TaxID=4639 RepID=A0AAV8QG96_ENSVE|nr:hypothetical protein OPV22_019365 [Ensete ventricosum]
MVEWRGTWKRVTLTVRQAKRSREGEAIEVLRPRKTEQGTLATENGSAPWASGFDDPMTFQNRHLVQAACVYNPMKGVLLMSVILLYAA